MKRLIPFSLCLALFSCEQKTPLLKDASEPSIAAEEEVTVDLTKSVMRINSTSQSWNPGQPWEKTPPGNLRSLGAIVAPGQVLTTGEMVANSTYLELESTDGSRTAQAKILVVDYEANLALLTVKSDDARDAFFKGTQPLALAVPPVIGDALGIFQVEDNGTTLMTNGSLQSVDVSESFLPGQSFLTYMVKASMQSAASSFSLPVIRNSALSGILMSYDSKDQISDVLSVDVISRFLANAQNGEYKGFPSLGVTASRTEDPSFRKFLKLQPEQGGLYIGKVRKGGAADLGGVKVGDVLLSVAGHAIDNRGYYVHPHYGSLFWSHIVRGEKSNGEEIVLEILRGGEPMEITATLTREEPMDRLVPSYQFDRAPNFLVKGGFIFQELTRPVLEAFGEDWSTRAPLNLLDAYENPEKFADKAERVIFLSGAIPTPATVGYERLRHLIVKKVNGVEIASMKNLIAAFEKADENDLHSIEFMEEDLTIYLDENISADVDSALLKRGLNRLSRAE